MEDVSTGQIALRLLAVLLLVLANGFFVAAEFALVAARRTRLKTLISEGDKKAKLADGAITHLDRYISGTQLGITLASLGLGWIGEPAVAVLIEGFFHQLPERTALVATHGVAVAIAFAFITFLHIVFGELAPKSLALLHPETVSRWVAAPLIGFTRITSPFIWALNGTANLALKMVGARQPTEAERVHRPEEIVMLVKQSQRSGDLAPQDVEMIEGVFEFTEKKVRDVMTPRTQVIGFSDDLTIEDSVELVADAGRSRFPVYAETLDNIQGVLHAKEILANLKTNKFKTVASIMADPFFVPGSREVEDLLADMRRTKTHFAVVLDEFGGTAGIVTMEDLLEEIVGEIYDEYDEPEEEPTEEGDQVVLPGDTPSDEANEDYGLGIEEDDYQTVGGYVFGMLGRLPQVGDRVTSKAGFLQVVEMDGRRVERVRLLKK